MNGFEEMDGLFENLDRETLEVVSYERSKFWSNFMDDIPNAHEDEEIIDLDDIEDFYNNGKNIDAYDDGKETNTESMAEEIESIDNDEDPSESVMQNSIFFSQNLTPSNARGILAQINKRVNETGIVETEIQKVLQQTLPIVEEYRQSWREAGLERILNTFDINKIEEKVGSWMRRNNSILNASISPISRNLFAGQWHRHDKRPYYARKRDEINDDETDTDTSFHSIDTARYIRSSRKALGTLQKRFATTTTTIKSYCLIERKRDELRRKYAYLAPDDTMRLYKTERLPNAPTLSSYRNPWTECRSSDHCGNNRMRLAAESHRIRRRRFRHRRHCDSMSCSSDSTTDEDAYDRCPQRSHRSIRCARGHCSCRTLKYSPKSYRRGLESHNNGKYPPYMFEKECSCIKTNMMCNSVRHLANSSSEEWLVENCIDSSKHFPKMQQLSTRQIHKRALMENSNCTEKTAKQPKLLEEIVDKSEEGHNKHTKKRLSKSEFKNGAAKKVCVKSKTTSNKQKTDEESDDEDNTEVEWQKYKKHSNEKIKEREHKMKKTNIMLESSSNRQKPDEQTGEKNEFEHKLKQTNKTSEMESEQTKKLTKDKLSKSKPKKSTAEKGIIKSKTTSKKYEDNVEFAESSDAEIKWQQTKKSLKEKSLKSKSKNNTVEKATTNKSKTAPNQQETNEAFCDEDAFEYELQKAIKLSRKQYKKEMEKLLKRENMHDQNKGKVISSKADKVSKNSAAASMDVGITEELHTTSKFSSQLNRELQPNDADAFDENFDNDAEPNKTSTKKMYQMLKKTNSKRKSKETSNDKQSMSPNSDETENLKSCTSSSTSDDMARVRKRTVRPLTLNAIQEYDTEDSDATEAKIIRNEVNYRDKIAPHGKALASATSSISENTTFFANSANICNSTALNNGKATARQIPTGISVLAVNKKKQKTNQNTNVNVATGDDLAGTSSSSISTVIQVKPDTSTTAYNEKEANDCTVVSSTTDNDLQQVTMLANTMTQKFKPQPDGRIILYTPHNTKLVPEHSIVNGRFKITQEHLASVIGERAAAKFMKYYVGPRNFKLTSTVCYRPPKCDVENLSSDSDTDFLELCSRYGELYESKS